jgi:hypothetical protein
MVSAIERQILQSKVIERIQQVQQQHPDMHFEVHLSKERRKMNKKINESLEMYNIGLSEEGKKDQKERQKNHEPTEPVGDGEASSEQDQHGHIDIKV